MTTNNINNLREKKRITEKAADDSLDKYNKIMKIINDLSEKENLISNVKDMRQKLNKLMVDETLNKQSLEYKILKSKIDQNEESLCNISDFSARETLLFMDICKDFRETYDKVGGDLDGELRENEDI